MQRGGPRNPRNTRNNGQLEIPTELPIIASESDALDPEKRVRNNEAGISIAISSLSDL